MIKKKFWISVLALGLMMVAFVGQASAAETGKTPAETGEQPWMVALVDSSTSDAKEGQFCGGSLIAPNWVLTAAHCVEGIQSANEVDIVIGRHTLSSNAGERITAAEIAVHKGYPDLADGEDNDIALIRLSRPATAGTPIKLITSTSSPADDAGSVARVTGWGVLSEESEEGQDILHGVDIPVVSAEACRAVYGDDVTGDAICAGKESGGADSCYGDSGGPLVGKDGAGNPVQIGVVSWGEECGASGQYGVYARVTYYNQWITDVMNGTAETIEPSDIPTDFGSEDGEWGDEEWDDEGNWSDEEWDDDGNWSDEEWDDEGFWSDEEWDDEGFWSDEEWDDEGYWDDESLEDQ